MSLAITPGPEGLNCKLYGIQFGSYSNTLWKMGEISNNQVLESQTAEETFWPWGSASGSLQIRCTFPDPYNPLFRKDVSIQASIGPFSAGTHCRSSLQLERERPAISEVNIHGDPLGGDPTEVRYITYHTPTEKVGNQITFKKYTIHVVPVDFVIQLSVRGDKELGWENTHLWFMLQTTVWRTAFTDSQVQQIQEWLDRDPPENATLSAYEYKGGFPIWGWVGEWDPLVWYDEEEREDQPPQEAYDNVRIFPSLEGRELTLYTGPSYSYDLDMEEGSDITDPENLQDILIGDIAALPDPDFATTVYTPIYIEKFFPYWEEGPWWDHWIKQWFPTTYLRVRLMYAIYGEFTYLWTEEEAEQQDYEWETKYSQYKYSAGPWEWLAGLSSFLMSPSGILSMLLVLGLIVIVIIFLINPALLLGLFNLKKGGGKR